MSGADELRSAGTKFGFWCGSGDPMILEAAASTRPDWICIDTQHGVDLGRVDASVVTAVSSYDVPVIIRVPTLAPSAIGRALDLGAVGVVVPLVETSAQAEAAVSATRYAPKGARSYGMQTPRIGPFEETPFVVIQIETAASIDNLDAIAAVDGVDALYVGPADLGLGLTGEPEFDLATALDGGSGISDGLNRVVEASRSNGIKAGLHCPNGAVAAVASNAGFEMMAVSSDTGAVVNDLKIQLETARP